LLTAASVLDDSPLQLAAPTGLYVPQNYENDFKGPVSVRTSLASSLNIPAVRAIILVTPDALVTRLRELGLSYLNEDGNYYGSALALGSAEVSLWQLVNAYRTLANGGRYSPLRLQAGASEPPVAVLDPATSYIVSDILSDRAARSLTFGLENALATSFWTAVKTGTSKDMRDNWCVGYSDRYTVGVWLGNFDAEPMKDVSGVTGAAPVWLELMRSLHARSGSKPPKAPAGVVAAEVTFSPAIESTRREWFLRGTETTHMRVLDRSTQDAARIAYPKSGTILALDPDIPSDSQRVYFQTLPEVDAPHFALDGERFDAGAGWSPTPGTHRLALLDANGAELDDVEFEVRGAPAR
jgi:penicillin-binding protein 1C